MGVYHKMKDILASVTSCIGAKGNNREKYVVCVRYQQQLPATLWYVYKYHADFVRLFDELYELSTKTSCAQECWIGSMLASLKQLLDPTATEKLTNLNQFLQKIVCTLRQTEHADVCLLRTKVDGALQAFLEWRDETRGLKRQLSLPSIHTACAQNETSAAQSECMVLDSTTHLRKTTFASHSYPAKITKLEPASPSHSSFSSTQSSNVPLGVLNKLRQVNTAEESQPTKCGLLYQDMFRNANMNALPVIQSRRRVFTEVNFDGL